MLVLLVRTNGITCVAGGRLHWQQQQHQKGHQHQRPWPPPCPPTSFWLLYNFFTTICLFCLFLSSICIPLVRALGALGHPLYCPFALGCKKEQILRLLHSTYFSFGSMLEHPEIEHFQVVFRVGSPTNRSDILANIVGLSLGVGGLSIHAGNLRTLSWDILRFCQTETG